MEIKIGNKKVGGKNSVFVIAEAGVNHNGKINLAKKLVNAAVECGADAIKFQNFITEEIIRKNAPKAAYQSRNIGRKKSQYDMLKELELNPDQTSSLKKYCDKKGIIFLSTAYDFKSLKLLEKINVVAHKLASIDAVCHPLIKKIAQTKKPLILSTGMTTEKEVNQAVKIFKTKTGSTKNLILLQCNTNYPAKPQDQNLLVMNTLKKYVPIVGFSDHTEGNEISIAAVALGAKVIEKHFTLNKNMPGPDHKASMDPQEFKMFVRKIKKVESALGSEIKKPTGGELENIIGMRRSICAKIDIPKNTVLTENHFVYKRPRNGLSPTENNIKKLIGKKTKESITVDENINLNLVK